MAPGLGSSSLGVDSFLEDSDAVPSIHAPPVALSAPAAEAVALSAGGALPPPAAAGAPTVGASTPPPPPPAASPSAREWFRPPGKSSGSSSAGVRRPPVLIVHGHRWRGGGEERGCDSRLYTQGNAHSASTATPTPRWTHRDRSGPARYRLGATRRSATMPTAHRLQGYATHEKRTKKRGQNNAADPPTARHRRDAPQRMAKRRQRLSNLTQPPSPRRHPLTQPPPDLRFARAMLCQHRPAEEGGLLPKRAAMQARKACSRGAPEEGVGGGECARSEAERGARTYADSDDPGGQR